MIAVKAGTVIALEEEGRFSWWIHTPPFSWWILFLILFILYMVYKNWREWRRRK